MPFSSATASYSSATSGQQRRQVQRREGRAPRASLDLGDAQQRLEHRDDAIEVGGRPLDRGTQLAGGAGMQPPRPPAGRARG